MGEDERPKYEQCKGHGLTSTTKSLVEVAFMRQLLDINAGGLELDRHLFKEHVKDMDTAAAGPRYAAQIHPYTRGEKNDCDITCKTSPSKRACCLNPQPPLFFSKAPQTLAVSACSNRGDDPFLHPTVDSNLPVEQLDQGATVYYE